MLKKANNKIFIYIGEIDLHPWKEIDKARVYLDNKGQIKVDELIIPDNRRRDFREKFEFLKEYLEKKKLPYDVSKFWRRELRNVILEMEKKKQKIISFGKLSDIYNQNYIAEIGKDAFEKIGKNCLKKYKIELRRR